MLVWWKLKNAANKNERLGGILEGHSVQEEKHIRKKEDEMRKRKKNKAEETGQLSDIARTHRNCQQRKIPL